MELSPNDVERCLYVVSASAIGKCLSHENLDEVVSQSNNLVRSVLILNEGSFYWLGVGSQVTIAFAATRDGNDVPEASYVTKRTLRANFRRGRYTMNLHYNDAIVRSIPVYVQPQRYDKASANVTNTLIPGTLYQRPIPMEVWSVWLY